MFYIWFIIVFIITEIRVLDSMETNKVAIIHYAEGFTTKDENLYPVMKEKEIMLSGTKRFHNCLYLILGLNKLQRILMDWLSEEMDDLNMVKNDKYVRQKFLNFLESIQLTDEKKAYKDQSVANAFHGLKKSGLLLEHSRMYYKVNPMYYWRGNDKDRIDEIMMNIRFKSTETNFKVLNGGKWEVRLKGKQ